MARRRECAYAVEADDTTCPDEGTVRIRITDQLYSDSSYIERFCPRHAAAVQAEVEASAGLLWTATVLTRAKESVR